MSPENSNITRWVAFLILPLATLAGAWIAIKAKAWFNYDLDPAEATAYIVSIVAAIAGGIGLWLHNRGKYEIAKATGIDEDKIDQIVGAVVSRLPSAPSSQRSAGEESLGSPPG
jgi:hypothetical protein